MRDAPQSPAQPSPLVIALVGSAGGIQAASAVLADLPADLPAAVVVAIHQDAGRPQRALADVLARASALPVELAGDDAPLLAGRAVVVPPGRHLLIDPVLRTRLVDAGPYPPHRPSADVLLSTLATAAGPRGIAVILSGAGHDGAMGATAVHALGGTVLTTDEPSTAIFGMPRATIRRDHPDRVLPLAAVAGALVRRAADAGAARGS